MRAMAWCLLMLSLVGCQSGPRWFVRDRAVSGRATYSHDLPADSSGGTDADGLTVPPAPSDYEQSSRTRKPSTSSQQAARSRGATGSRKPSTGASSRSSQLASKKPGTSTRVPSTRPTAQDETVKQLMVDLEKTKREKSGLQTKLSEETAKQTQQRLELEARMAVLQEQLRQQSALQQVSYQPHNQTMSRPNSSYGPPMGQNYNGPVITSGAPSPTTSSFAPTSTGVNSVPFNQGPPAWNNGSAANWNAPAPSWNSSAPAWNTQSSSWNASNTQTQAPVEMWPHSPQRR